MDVAVDWRQSEGRGAGRNTTNSKEEEEPWNGISICVSRNTTMTVNARIILEKIRKEEMTTKLQENENCRRCSTRIIYRPYLRRHVLRWGGVWWIVFYSCYTTNSLTKPIYFCFTFFYFILYFFLHPRPRPLS